MPFHQNVESQKRSRKNGKKRRAPNEKSALNEASTEKV